MELRGVVPLRGRQQDGDAEATRPSWGVLNPAATAGQSRHRAIIRRLHGLTPPVLSLEQAEQLVADHPKKLRFLDSVLPLF